MKLIVEQVDSEINYVIEESNGKKKMCIEGIFLQSEKQNKNGRVYPRTVMESAVNRYVTEQINRNRAMGELGHPSSTTINLDKVSHKITDLHWEGNDIHGKAILLDTPMGKIAKTLVESGVTLGVSSRGVGSITQSGGVSTVKEDFILATIDIVADPSAPDAFVNGIMEGVDYFIDNGILKAKQAEEMQREIKSAKTPHELTCKKLAVFESFLHSLLK